jgi:signal transduction histidine kinase
MKPSSPPFPPRPGSRPPGRTRFDLAQTRADLLDSFLLALLFMLPLFTGFRFMASWGTGPWPFRILFLPVMYLGIACLYLGRRRVGYQARVHILLGLVLGFWIQQVFLVGPMEPGAVALAEIIPLAAGLFFSPRVGWCYLFGLMGVFLLGAGLEVWGLVPPYPFTQGWQQRRIWDFWLLAALGLPMLSGSFLVAIRRLFDAWAGLVAGLEREMADRDRLQEQLLQSQKLESIGRLAGGVAHDMNNMITAVLGHAHLMETELPPGTSLRQHLDGIHQAGMRSSGIVRQLLIFTRQQPTRPEALDLNARIQDTRNLLAPLVGEDIDVRFVAGTGLWKVSIDPVQLDQVLLNLVVNARDAMPGGGLLTLATANIRITGADCLGNAYAAPGPHVRLTVSDEGTGMTRETLQRIFEPFFTTKEPGKGTGLGLATVFGIVQQAGGFIDVYTELGLGTAFKVYLPAKP